MDNLKSRAKLYEKINKLQEVMASFDWEKDGKNTHQKYKYYSEAQYKRNFQDALLKVGLVWEMENIGYEFIPNATSSMHLIVAQFKGYLIDPESAEREEYTFFGSGADNGDKALYKAYTGALKFFLASNFLVAENNDPEGDEKVDKPKFVTSEQKEEIKEELLSGKANALQIETLKKLLKKLIEKSPEKEVIVIDLAKETENFTNLTQEKAESLILEIGKLIK